MEMQGLRSRPFVAFVAPLARETFGGNGPAWDEDNIHALYAGEADFIRSTPTSDLSGARDPALSSRGATSIARHGTRRPAGGLEPACRKLLGIVPPPDREGCLQDIHWYDAPGATPDLYAGAIDSGPALATPAAAPGRRFRGDRQGRLRAAAAWLRENCTATLPPLDRGC